MKVDLYEHCPCGSGKKIKFCCKDLAREIESITTKISGQQFASAQAQIERLLKEQPDRECLLAIKATLHLQLGDLEATKTTLDRFLGQAPENPIALAILATVKSATPPPDAPDDEDRPRPALSEEAAAAVAALQESLEKCGDVIPVQLYDAVGAVGERLLMEGQIIGAREHFVFQAALSPDESSAAVSRVMEIDGSTEIPLLLKQDLLLQVPPEEETDWKPAYEEIFELGQRGQWGHALEKVNATVEKFPDVPFLRRAQGVLACRLGRSDEALEAWRDYSRGEGVDHDEAVEAAALAQVLQRERSGKTVDMVEVTYDVQNAEQTLSKLQSDNRCIALALDFSRIMEDGPPPKAGFSVLDREMPQEVTADTDADQLPQVLAQVLLYGKETDKEARLVYHTYRGKWADDTVALLRDVTSESLGEPTKEEVLGTVSVGAVATRFQTQLPEKTPPHVRSALLSKARRHIALKRWPDAPHDALGGKTPKEASQDESLRIPLEAAILVLELMDGERESNEDFIELRKQLGLDLPARPDTAEVRKTPVLRLMRIDGAALSNEDLRSAFAMAMQKGIRVLIVRFGRELLSRDTDEANFKRDELLGVLSRYVEDPDESLRLIQEAQRVAVKRGDSPATWKIHELGMRLMRQEATEFQALLANIQTNHIKEPGISQLLLQQLARFGIVRPDGRPAKAPQPYAQQPSSVVGVAAPGLTSTPAAEESEESQPAGEGKSKLWLPGMD